MTEGDNREGSKRQPASLPATSNIALIRTLEERLRAQRPLGIRVSDALTRVFGSMPFVVFHVIWFMAWFFINSGGASAIVEPFDPFPFGILTLAVSAEGVFLAMFVLISQNRMMRDADRRAHIDLQVNLLTEQSSTKTLQILQQISEHLGLRDVERDSEAARLAEPTNMLHLIDELEQSLNKK